MQIPHYFRKDKRAETCDVQAGNRAYDKAENGEVEEDEEPS